MRPWTLLRYFWGRRKVARRAAHNWLLSLLGERLRPRVARGDEAVIFVSMNARGRQFNHADLLRRRGVRTVLLSRVFDYRYQREAFDEVRVFLRYRDLPRQVRALARRLRILAVVGTHQPTIQGRVLLEMERDWPVIIDPYDSWWALSHFAGLAPEEALLDPGAQAPLAGLVEEAAREEGNLRRADGVIARSRPLEMLLEHEGVDTPRLLLEDACNPRWFRPIAPRSGPKQGEWSVVYAGIFYPMSADPRLHGDAQLLPLARLFAEERIHFHLYPSPHHDYFYPEYEEEAARNPYLHLHRSVGFGRIHEEISRYDFGWYAGDCRRTAVYSDVCWRHLMSMKFFTYLEAGLPVLASELTQQSTAVLRRCGAGIVLGPDAPRGLAAVLAACSVEDLLAGVARAREHLSLERRGEELEEFLRSCRPRRRDLAARPARREPLRCR